MSDELTPADEFAWKQVVDTIPKSSLEKLCDPICDVVGRGIAGCFTYIFYKPLEFGIVSKKHFNDLVNGTADKISKIPKENIDNSKADQLLNIIENSKHSISDDEIRNMYKKIIANTVDNRKNKNINNYFATVISNLSSESAEVLRMLYKNEIKWLPYVKVVEFLKSKSDGAMRVISTGNTVNLSEFKKETNPKVVMMESSINVLESLGIITKSGKSREENAEEVYLFMRKKLTKEARKANFDIDKIEFVEKTINLTELGYEFINICY
ncbi:hypothetical protein BGL34_00695 [Fructilactobacillus lindneri]|nr:Abi-alpha family protein [Fructilactobacillus lindneri]ANZ58303.1 hypothetical protein AYR60_05885 [Fructilactobacillus lindneri]ANZ59625.1 hypothetical protein AYR59_06140 [Fructilactobacillus lindneri]POG98591.1 hypothetical protein BGL31_01285 [Fructilactobacillus lindneri]POH03979.1 hypothetical protein BGL32_01225 [Fructilactobacillus lindneri]POH04779.1 hypothetical protein BGL33_00670 [Fructilactobacillus lindneri]